MSSFGSKGAASLGSEARSSLRRCGRHSVLVGNCMASFMQPMNTFECLLLQVAVHGARCPARSFSAAHFAVDKGFQIHGQSLVALGDVHKVDVGIHIVVIYRCAR